MPRVSNIEITQAIQAYATDVQQNIPLLLGKSTLARVYLCDLDYRSNVTSDSIEGVLKITLVDEGGKPDVCVDSKLRLVRDSSFGDSQLEQRLNLESTLNFEFNVTELFQTDLLAGKDVVRVKIEIDSLFVNGVKTGFTGNRVVTEKFINDIPFKMHILGLRYWDDSETVYYPSAEHFENTRQSIENLFPIGKCIASQVVIDADAEFTLPFVGLDESEPDWQWFHKVSLAHAQLLAHRTLDLDANPDSMLGTWYYGMADYPAHDFFRGAASGVQEKAVEKNGKMANFDLVSCGPVEDAGGLYAAHEIAHCLDLHHPGIGDQARVETEYPFVEGYLSVDRYPTGVPFDNPDGISRFEADRLWGRYVSEESLANNHTLGLIIDRYNKNRYQGLGGTANAGLPELRTDLALWKDTAAKYGAEHLGWQWRNWKLDHDILSYKNFYDFMGYLQPKWISSFSYIKLFKNIGRYEEQVYRDSFKDRATPPNICIIGLYNEVLGTGAIKYVFKTFEKPRRHPAATDRSIRIRFDDYPVDPQYIHYKDRANIKLGDPVFLKAGIFKCVVSASECFAADNAQVSLSDRERLYLDIAQWESEPGSVSRLNYRTIDRKLMLSEEGSPHFDCKNQPFNIERTSSESEDADFYLQLIAQSSSNCSYIARARFFDYDKFKNSQKIELTNWITLGVNFRAAHSLYIDKNHCLLPASALGDIRSFLFGAEPLPQPFKKIYQVKDEMEQREARTAGLFAFAVELTCLSPRPHDQQSGDGQLFESTVVFKGMVIEKPHNPGEFYFIDFKDKRYQGVRKKFEEVS